MRLFKSSWDDGHPDDLRLAEELALRGLNGTFFVPLSNCEGRPVMTSRDIRTLAEAGFTIGCHGLDHRRLPALPPAEARRQIVEGRDRLQDILGRAVHDFCYPGGRHDARIRRLVAEAGFTSARTTEMFRMDSRGDPLIRPTTLQFYPHGGTACIRNWLSHGGGGGRLRVAGLYLTEGKEAVLRRSLENAGQFHLWGHSWEISERALWPALTAFLDLAAALARGCQDHGDVTDNGDGP